MTTLSLLVLILVAPAAQAACQVDCTNCINKAEGFPMRLPWATGGNITIAQAYGSGWHCAKDFYSLDFYLPLGTSVYPVAPGRIFQTGNLGDYGNYVMVDHQNGYQSLYAHLRAPVTLANGTLVGTSSVIGSVGSSGTTEVHLHLTLYQGARWPGDAQAVGVVPETMGDCLRNGSLSCYGLVSGNTVTKTPACDAQSQCAQCILSVRNDILTHYQSAGWNTQCQNWDAIVNNWCGPSMEPSACAALRGNQCDTLCSNWEPPPSLLNVDIETTSASQHGYIQSWGPRGAWAFHTSYPKSNNGDLGSKFGYYSAGTTETVGQLLSARFKANTRYVFASRASGGADNLGTIPYQIGYANIDNSLGSFVALSTQAISVDGATGWVPTQGVTYITPASGGPIGKQIIVRLGDYNAGGRSDIWYDNFILTVSAP
ncbi:M23 family metallopeptidase [Corallococcus terminator]|uniref:M23 family metallopeptidase n=1 Tax=Corallococcus terminator TaxID=2316733 RepID=UPI0013158D11|nr:M23 family metallopeptidase [Corallococcus terminator]